MAQLEKLKDRFRDCRKDFSWRDFENMIEKMGYVKLPSKQTGGSRRKYKRGAALLMLDEPHDGVMGPGMVKRLRQDLIDAGLL